MPQAKLPMNREEELYPRLECDYLCKLGAFGYQSVDAAQWVQFATGPCTAGSMPGDSWLVIGSMSVRLRVVGCRGIHLLPLLCEGRLMLLLLQ